jgi:hypothetical protein
MVLSTSVKKKCAVSDRLSCVVAFHCSYEGARPCVEVDDLVEDEELGMGCKMFKSSA